MKARASILTMVTSVALIAPAAHAAADSGNIVGCAARTTKAADAAIVRSPLSGRGVRALQLVQLGEAASRMLPARTACGVEKTKAVTGSNRFQVLRDAL